jgi:hypothetical protein
MAGGCLMDASLLSLCNRVKELDPCVTDSMLENMVHGFSSLGDRRCVLASWIEDLEAEVFYQSIKPEISLILDGE